MNFTINTGDPWSLAIIDSSTTSNPNRLWVISIIQYYNWFRNHRGLNLMNFSSPMPLRSNACSAQDEPLNVAANFVCNFIFAFFLVVCLMFFLTFFLVLNVFISGSMFLDCLRALSPFWSSNPGLKIIWATHWKSRPGMNYFLFFIFHFIWMGKRTRSTKKKMECWQKRKRKRKRMRQRHS